VDTLTPMKITFRRMRLLIDVAGQVAAGALDLEALRDESPQAAYDALLAIKGIGHWTATYTISRVFGPLHPYVGDNDVALQAAVNHYYYGGKGRIPPEEVRATFAPYGEFAGAAATFTIMRLVHEKYA
jgi:3-methyladenine DNA glycosylase/8-oxoguanine DNA glycosylase